MGIGSIGKDLATYHDSDTFLSTDAGVNWKMITKDAHKFEFGDKGSIIVIINDEERVDTVSYSTDFGETWFVLPCHSPTNYCLSLGGAFTGKRSILVSRSAQGH